MSSSSTRWCAAACVLALGILIQFRAKALEVLPVFALALPFVVHFLRKRSKRQKSAGLEVHLNGAQSTSYLQKPVDRRYVDVDIDDHVRWSFIPSNGELHANARQAVEQENEDAKFRFLVMHAPTHDESLNKSGKWRYGWHFLKKKRKWEVRVQVQFKKPPKGKIYFGVEMSPAAGVSSTQVKFAKGVILQALRAAIGNGFYQTAGDDPDQAMTSEKEDRLRRELSVLSVSALEKRAKEAFATDDELKNASCCKENPQQALVKLIVDKAKELEPGAFIMPMWVLDQFHVSDIGKEPDITGNFDGIGVRRTEAGVKKYGEQMVAVTENLDPNKMYTFLFWGISQYIDVNAWTFAYNRIKLDALKLSGPPPIYVVAYDMVGDGAKRHLVSRKRYYFKVALWSHLKPPSPDDLRRVLRVGDEEDEADVNNGHQTKQNSGRLRRSVGKSSLARKVLSSFDSCKVQLGCMGHS